MAPCAAVAMEPMQDGRAEGADAMMEQAAETLRSAGIERPVFEAQLLLAIALHTSRGNVIARWPFAINDVVRLRWMDLVAARAQRKPLAYLRGMQEFYGLPMNVSPDVLVPRPETELLVDRALAESERLTCPVIVDACTGSGCVAAALASRLMHAQIVATDISRPALEVARTNLRTHAVGAVPGLVQCCTLRALASEIADIVTANPPYVSSSDVEELQPEVRDHEPRIALDGGPDGLTVIHDLIPEALRALKPHGLLIMEVALGQSDRAAGILSAAGFTHIAAYDDLAGIPRVVEGRKP